MTEVAPMDAAPGVQEPVNEGTWGTVKSLAKRMFFFYMVTSVMKNFMGTNTPAPTATSTTGGGVAPSAAVLTGHNVFDMYQQLDFYMYLSDSDNVFHDFTQTDALFWKKEKISYGNWDQFNPDGFISHSKTFPTPQYLINNASIYLHAFVTKHGKSPDPTSPTYKKHEVIYGVHKLNKHKKKHYKKTANLLTGVSEISDEDLKKAEIMKYEVLNFWHNNLTVNLVYDFTQLTSNALPAPFDKYVKFDARTRTYKPIMYFNSYWNLNTEYMPLNDTVKEITLDLTFQPLSFFKFQMYASQSEKSQWSAMLGQDTGDDEGDGHDSIKTALIETNIYLLGLTVIVSILHTVFEVLAFKNDIAFWKNKKSAEGLSVRTVLINVVQQFIMLLYIIDNDTNYMIRVSGCIGLIIELWKVPKCMNVSIDYENKLFGIIPRIKIEDQKAYVESQTKEYDDTAFKYLSWLCFPLLVGYAVYSLVYHEQKGWYSWVLNMFYGYLLAFGFIMMTPQLFINYKLKSVAHLPWRQLMYKTLSTFVDDLFSFVIKMPTLYRIGCFRDDLIFFVYLYQKWAYRVDYNRVNEYGISGEDMVETKEIKDNTTAEPIESKKDK
uniref:Cleft lip and palate associated transmembrane protein 1 n=1 Tax=Rhabditophanes sp. KR3021 TaxID=114890 RepID=A0AC35UGN7_9BILA